MKRYRRTYTIFQKVASVFLMLALLWLTVSMPFVADSMAKLAKQQNLLVDIPLDNCADETGEDANNNLEEKVPGGSNLSEEFLHEHHSNHYFASIISSYHKLENSDTYIAFHGEQLVPPPNAA
jgi:hypothetical protein